MAVDNADCSVLFDDIVGDSFTSFEEFKTKLSEFCEKSGTVYYKVNTHSVENENKRRKVPIPPQMKYCRAKFKCVHFGEARSCSLGIRKNQKYRPMGCCASFALAFTDGLLRVKSKHLLHSYHPLNSGNARLCATFPNSLMKNKKMSHPVRLLIGCTGSVASILIPSIVNSFLESDITPEIKVVPTESALHFFDRQQVTVPVLTEEDEWQWSAKTDPVLHIELRKWADIMLIAPLDANSLAKIANGLCDNLLTCIVRAWDLKKPLLFAPAMNTLMWEHPITSKQIGILKELGYREIPCISKKLVCGDTGYGAMAKVDDLVTAVREVVNSSQSTSSSS